MRNRFVFTILSIVLIAAGFIYYSIAKKSGGTTPVVNNEQSGNPPTVADELPAWKQASPPAPSSLIPASPRAKTPEPRTFILTADEYGISPSRVTVKKMTPVTLVIRMKTLNVKKGALFIGGEVATDFIRPGQSASVNFTATESFTIRPYQDTDPQAPPLKYSLEIVVE